MKLRHFFLLSLILALPSLSSANIYDRINDEIRNLPKAPGSGEVQGRRVSISNQGIHITDPQIQLKLITPYGVGADGIQAQGYCKYIGASRLVSYSPATGVVNRVGLFNINGRLQGFSEGYKPMIWEITCAPADQNEVCNLADKLMSDEFVRIYSTQLQNCR